MSQFFFFNDTATTEIYTLSLHDALPISLDPILGIVVFEGVAIVILLVGVEARKPQDRKSTRLNSSHSQISYAVFCLKKTTNRVVSVCVIVPTLHALSRFIGTPAIPQAYR